jgi:uncharacterized protein (TIGR03083 family)
MRVMPSHLSLDQHLDALRGSGALLRDAARRAGLATPVPTCPDWDVAALLTHQGMVHRWAAANLRGDDGHDPRASVAEAGAATDLLDWYSRGLAALVDTIAATTDDVRALVFLKDAPPPRRFWARRQAHETTVHAVDAVSASLGRWPAADDVVLDPALAADGVDELLTGFVPRGRGKLHAERPYRVLVRADDTGHAWTVRIGDGPVETTVGGDEDAEVVFTGTATQLYLGLWNRSDEIDTHGRADVLDQWRRRMVIRWAG